MKTPLLLFVGLLVGLITPLGSGKVPHWDPGAVPAGLNASEWTGIRAAYEAGHHSVQPQEDGSLAARNAGQGWRTVFDGRGFLSRPQGGGWSWGLELSSYGFADAMKKVSGKSKVSHAANRVVYARDGDLTEWFVNDQRGLEQGWTIQKRHEPLLSAPDWKYVTQPLRLELEVRGGLTPQISSGGDSVSFRDENGGTVLTYGGLKAWDADGRALTVRFEAAGPAALRVAVEEREAQYPITIDPIAQQAYLKASNTDAADAFGRSVAVSGDTVVVGAYGERSNATGVNAPLTGASGTQGDNSLSYAGAAYIFVRSGGTWTQQAYLKASNPGTEDYFGWSVAVSGDTVVVGASQERSNAKGVNAPLTGGSGTQGDNSLFYAGAAYIFVRSGGLWSQQAYLKASNTGQTDRFGTSVAVSGDTVVVGAEGEESNAKGVNAPLTGGSGTQANNSAGQAGAAYVFVRSAGTWSQQAYLKASNTGLEDEFGVSVGVSDDTIVVGAPDEDSNATGANAPLTGGSGTQADNSASSSGASYVFVRNGGTWSQQAYLKASNTGAGDDFGIFVAVSGNTLVVGAHWEDSNATGVNTPVTGGSGTQADNSAPNSGAAYTFVRSGGTWSQQAYLKASNTAAGDEFGVSVAVAGDTVVVGAPAEDSNATGVNAPLTGGSGTQVDNSADHAGAAYLFVRSDGIWTPHAYLKASNTGANDWFGHSVAVSPATAVVGAYVESSNATGVNAPLTGGSGTQSDNSTDQAGASYVFTGFGAAPPPVPELEMVLEEQMGALLFLTDTGYSYTVQQSQDLSSWTDLAVLPGDGTLVHHTVPGPGIYRVKVTRNP